ncbi:MAG: Gldg family protein [Crocinitomicaceae bacterium]|nr:Gldg family protein [Crocinitomicaceae bacterium]
MAGKNTSSDRFFNWFMLVIVAIGIILVNIIFSLLPIRIDMTEDQRYSLAPGTIEFLNEAENFNSRLNITIYLEGNLPAEINQFRNAIEHKLNEFMQYSGDRIEYTFINPSNGTEEENQEVYQEIFAEGNGILPMDIVYMEDAEQRQIMLWPGAILEYGSGQGSKRQAVQLLPGSKMGMPYQLNGITDIIQNSVNNLEYMLISSIRRVTQLEKPRIAFLHGHGELSFADTQRARALISPYFSIADVTINDSLAALDNVDGLIIARPRSAFSDQELFIIDQFLMRGGRLMCMLDKLYLAEDTLKQNGQTHTTRYDLRLDDMIFDYGLKLVDNYVMDAYCVQMQTPYAQKASINWFYHVLSSGTEHPIARNVEPVALNFAGEVQLLAVPDYEGKKQLVAAQNPNVTLTPILTSSTNSAPTGLAPMVSLGIPDTYGDNPRLMPNPEAEANKKCLAALAEGMFKSHFRNRIVDTYANHPDVTILDSSIAEGKVFLVGNGRMIANQYDSMPNANGNGFMYRPKQMNDLQFSQDMVNLDIPHFFGNQEFFQNLTDYMMGDNSVLDIRSRQIDIHEINKEEVRLHATFYKLLNIALPVIIILFIGIVLQYVRKRRFAH